MTGRVESVRSQVPGYSNGGDISAAFLTELVSPELDSAMTTRLVEE
jgi:hypothetical protein